MPHTKSAAKALRQTEKRRLRNRTSRKLLKNQLKEFYAAVESGTAEQQQATFRLAVKKVDKAAARGILHRNNASRKKSQLALMLAKATPKPAAEAASEAPK